MKTNKFASTGEHYCDNCCKTWTAGELEDIQDIYERVEAGATIPSGDCPECGSLCYPLEIEKTQPQKKYYIEIVQPCPLCNGRGGVWDKDEINKAEACEGHTVSYVRTLVTKQEYCNLLGELPDEEDGITFSFSDKKVPF